MNRAECQKLINSYVDWLRQGLSVEEVGGACELTTPFLDRHNDHLQVYAIRQNGKIVLSDDGYILSDLRTSGLEVDTPKRKMVLDSVLNGLGVRVENNQLLVEASASNLAQRLHSLVQAMPSPSREEPTGSKPLSVMAAPLLVAQLGQFPGWALSGRILFLRARSK